MRKLLVANRGEIAVRVIASAALQDLSTVAVYTADDRACAHVDRADEAFPLPGTGAAGYLDIDAVIAAAVTAGADAIHPGYGFLAENADFARRCAEREVVFVGPPPQALEAFGDKSRARAIAASLGIPVPRGTGGPATLDEVRRFLDGLGPGGAVMVKAVAGGGGRGMAPVRSAGGLAAAYKRCAAEARAAFGSAALYAEELLEGARHVEVQVAGDAAGTVLALGDRDCSVQRRRQKLIEIAPAPWLDDDVRAALHAAATALIAAVPYRGLATVEFLVRGRDITFLEVNPRIQVEHTVTEEVTGLDLVALALRLADGGPLAGVGDGGAAGLAGEPSSRGFAVQARVNAETVAPDGSVLAGAGRLDRFLPPGGRGVRVDTHGYPGYQVSPRYDSLLAKVIASGATLDEALARLRRALGEFDVHGVPVNRDLLLALTADPALRAGLIDTGYLDAHLPILVSSALVSSALAGVAHASSSAPEAGAPEAGTLGDGPGQSVALRASMPGVVVQVLAEAGAELAAGAEVIVFEAMKMHHVVVADRPCVIREVSVAVGDLVDAGQPVAYAEPSGAAGGTAQGAASADPDHIRDDLREALRRHRYTLDEGRPQVVERRHAHGRRTARENIADLVDQGSFVEYGGLTVAAQRSTRPVQDLIERTPADGVVLGTATAGGVPVAVMSYDYTVLAGTQGRMGHAKTDRFLRLAERSRLPVIVFGEGGGGRGVDTDGPATSGLDCQTFWHISRLVGQVPLIGVVSGFCFAGNAALIGACDVIIATSGSSLGMGGPAMIEGGGLGVYAPEEVGPMDVQTANGMVDILVPDERAAVAAAQAALSLLAGQRVPGTAADQRVQRHLVPENRLRAYDVRPVIDTLLDEGSGLELLRDYGRAMLTVLGRLDGRPVGVLASNPLHLGGAIDAEGADKATRFLRLCEARGLPVVSLCDTPGFMVGPQAERQGTVRRFGAMFAAAAALSVPQVTVVLRKAYGLGAMAVAGGYLRASVLTVAWPTGEFGPMGLEGMVRLGHRKELDALPDSVERERRFADRVAQLYERGKALNAASLFEIDDVIDPADTRSVIAAALSHARALPARPLLREQLAGADPVGVVVGDGGDDQLVRLGGVPQPLQLVGDLRCRAGELGVDAVGDQGAVGVSPRVAAGLRGRGELDGALGGADAAHPRPVAGGELAGPRLGIGDHHVGRYADVGAGEFARVLERGAVALHRLNHGGRADVVVRGEPQAALAGHLGAFPAAAAKDPHLQRRALARHHVRLLAVRGAVAARDQREHVTDLLGVVLRLRVRQLEQVPLQREPGRLQQGRGGEPGRDQQPVRGAAVHRGAATAGTSAAGASAAGTRRCLRPARAAHGAAKAEVEAPRVGRVEQAELLDDRQRGAVPHLHRAGTEPYRRRGGRGQGEHHGRGRARDARVEVVLGDPVAGVAERLGLPRQVHAVAQRLRRV